MLVLVAHEDALQHLAEAFQLVHARGAEPERDGGGWDGRHGCCTGKVMLWMLVSVFETVELRHGSSPAGAQFNGPRVKRV